MIIHSSHGRSRGLHSPRPHRRHKVLFQRDYHPRSTTQGVWSAWSGSGRRVVGNGRAYVPPFSLSLPVIAANQRANYPISSDSNIRLSRDELNEDYHDLPGLVEFSDGSGIYGSVAVYQSIHCIKRLHHLLHFDHYHPNKSAEETRALMHHGGLSLSIVMVEAKLMPLIDECRALSELSNGGGQV